MIQINILRSSADFLSNSLLISAAQGHIDVTKVLLDNGASYGEKDKVGFRIQVNQSVNLRVF